MIADGRAVLSSKGQLRLKRYLSESSEKLCRLLREIPISSKLDEFEFIKSFIPEFVSALGYADSETLYEYSIGALRVDVVLAPGVGDKPWLVIDVKSGAANVTKQAVRQLRSYMVALGSRLGVTISRSQIAIYEGEDVTLLNLSELNEIGSNGLLDRLARWMQYEHKDKSKSNREIIVELIEEVEKASTNQSKGRSLEKLAALLLNNIPSLICKYKNLNTRSSEIDLVVEYIGSKREIPLFEELGRYCLIECKNWSSPVGVAPVRDFLGKLRKSKTQLGIMFAKNGVTGEGTGLDALREIQSAYDRDGTFLLVFSLAEVKQLEDGTDLVVLLDQKSDSLRFDL